MEESIHPVDDPQPETEELGGEEEEQNCNIRCPICRGKTRFLDGWFYCYDCESKFALYMPTDGIYYSIPLPSELSVNLGGRCIFCQKNMQKHCLRCEAGTLHQAKLLSMSLMYCSVQFTCSVCGLIENRQYAYGSNICNRRN